MEKNKYTIKDAARIMGVPTSTIRYYEKEGLLPFVERLASGYRIFTEKDIATLRIIDCLKKPVCLSKRFVSSAVGWNKETPPYSRDMTCFWNADEL